LSDNPTTIRVDHRVSSNDNFFIKVNGGRRITNFLGTGAGTGAPTANGEANVTYLPMQAIAGALSWTHIFSPRLFVETVANHTWQSTKTITGPLTQQKDWAKELGLPNPYAEIGFPNITSLGNFMTYTEGDNRRALTTRVLNVAQNYQHIRGRTISSLDGVITRSTSHCWPDQGAISGSPRSAAWPPRWKTRIRVRRPILRLCLRPVMTAPISFSVTRRITMSASSDRTYGSSIRIPGLYLQDNYKVTPRLTLSPRRSLGHQPGCPGGKRSAERGSMWTATPDVSEFPGFLL